MLMMARKNTNTNRVYDHLANSRTNEEQKSQHSLGEDEEDAVFGEKELEFDKAPDQDVDEATLHIQ